MIQLTIIGSPHYFINPMFRSYYDVTKQYLCKTLRSAICKRFSLTGRISYGPKLPRANRKKCEYMYFVVSFLFPKILSTNNKNYRIWCLCKRVIFRTIRYPNGILGSSIHTFDLIYGRLLPVTRRLKIFHVDYYEFVEASSEMIYTHG